MSPYFRINIKKIFINSIHTMIINKSKIAFVTGYIGQSPTSIPKISKNVDSYFITNNKKISDNLIKKTFLQKLSR